MKLISLNIEGDRHWDTIDPFIHAERPDILCVQEAFESDVHALAGREGFASIIFAPMAMGKRSRTEPDQSPLFEKEGVAILSRAAALDTEFKYYKEPPEPLVPSDNSSFEMNRATRGFALAWMTIVQGQGSYTIATTHLVVTANGLPNDGQRADAHALLALGKTLPPHVLCGDFNMPRSVNDIYPSFTGSYTDAIPASILCSIDPVLHRTRTDPEVSARISEFMVDYIFTQPPYMAREVRQQCGVSDHCAFIAEIEKTV